jgi:transcriptional regulator with XRE-family HTH domain
MNMGNDFKFIRQISGMTQQEVADKIGVKINTYSQYENDVRKPSYEVLKKMTEVFGVSSDYFFKYEEIESDDDFQVFSHFLNRFTKSVLDAKRIMIQIDKMTNENTGSSRRSYFLSELAGTLIRYKDTMDQLKKIIDFDQFADEIEEYLE